MSPEQNLSDFYAEIGGQTEGILVLCTALFTLHPKKEEILALMHQFAGNVEPQENDNSETKSYKRGIKKVFEYLTTAVRVAELAAEKSQAKMQ